MYDIVIIGAGPAGMTAGIYARRVNKKVLILEGKNYGGQIVNTLDIENYPTVEHISGFDFATKLYEQAKKMGVEFVLARAEKIEDFKEVKEVVAGEEKYRARSVIIATGLVNRKLGIAGEDELIGRGISYCATCDGAFYRGKKVAVVGGGNVALGDALALADLAEKVYLIHRRDEFKGDAELVQKVRARENVEMVSNSVVTGVEGAGVASASVGAGVGASAGAGADAGEAGEIEGAGKAGVSEGVGVSGAGAGGLRAVEVENLDGEKRKIEVDGLFVAIGQMPENGSFADLIELDEAGYVLADEKCETNVSGIFVAGDNRSKEVRQLVTATADGAVAAVRAVNYLREEVNL